MVVVVVVVGVTLGLQGGLVSRRVLLVNSPPVQQRIEARKFMSKISKNALLKKVLKTSFFLSYVLGA